MSGTYQAIGLCAIFCPTKPEPLNSGGSTFVFTSLKAFFNKSPDGTAPIATGLLTFCLCLDGCDKTLRIKEFLEENKVTKSENVGMNVNNNIGRRSRNDRNPGWSAFLSINLVLTVFKWNKPSSKGQSFKSGSQWQFAVAQLNTTLDLMRPREILGHSKFQARGHRFCST